MKCVQKPDGFVARVTNSEAKRLVKLGWKYIPKRIWKEQKAKQ